MILSVSRRTDIPACFAGWFVQRLRCGEVLVRNPYNAQRAARVRLHPEVVDCVVFFSKNYAPLVPFLPEIYSRGYTVAFQYTLNAYGPPLEPRLPPLAQRVDVFRRLADKAGGASPHALTWRYDPVVLNARHSVQWHADAFGALCRALQGYASRCIFSFVDDYAHIRSGAGPWGAVCPETQRALAAQLAALAAEHGFCLSTCAEAVDLEELGITHAACLDAEHLSRVVGQPLRVPPGTGQRALCRCVRCVDVGAYNTCTQGCAYCYATSHAAAARRHARTHSEEAAALGDPLAEDVCITERAEASCKVPPALRQGSLLE